MMLMISAEILRTCGQGKEQNEKLAVGHHKIKRTLGEGRNLGNNLEAPKEGLI